MLEYIKNLIENGGNLNEADEEGKTLLMQVAERGDMYSLVLLLKHGANPFLVDSKGQTALHKAVICAQNAVVSLLTGAMKGAVNQCDKEGNTALDLARLNEDDALVELLYRFLPDQDLEPFLLKKVKKSYEDGVDFNLPDETGLSFLEKAIFHKYNQVARFLVERGVDINHQCFKGFTPLMTAIAGKNEEMVHLLVDKGADLFLKNHLGERALEMAVNLNSSEKIISILEAAEKKAIENGKDPFKQEREDFVGDKGYVRLVLAIANQDKKAMRYFIEEGVDLNFQGYKGETPLLNALLMKDIELSKILIENGADVNLANIFGETPLIRAVSMKDAQKISLLINAGADIWAQNKNGDSAMDFAVQNEWFELADFMKKLYQKRLGIDSFNDLSQTVECDTLLLNAVLSNKRKKVFAAVQNGADVNMVDDFGDPVLFMAIRENKFNSFQALVTMGANLCQKNSQGKSVINFILEQKWSSRRIQKYMGFLWAYTLKNKKIVIQKNLPSFPDQNQNERW